VERAFVQPASIILDKI